MRSDAPIREALRGFEPLGDVVLAEPSLEVSAVPRAADQQRPLVPHALRKTTQLARRNLQNTSAVGRRMGGSALNPKPKP